MALTGLTGAPVHAGSWNLGGIKLPDFGVTEAIQHFTNPQAQVTAQGGSNLSGRSLAAAPQVLGSQAPSNYQSVPGGNQYNPNPSPQQQQQLAGTGGAGISGGGASNSGAQIPQPQQPNTQSLDPMFQPALDALNNSIAPAQQGEAAQEAQLQADAQQQGNQITNSQQEQLGTLQNNQNSQQTQTQNAIAQARQGANEIQQGIQARYGGTTGTGGFASELAGRGTQSQIGQYNQNLINNLQSIDTARSHVNQLADSAKQDLASRVQAATQTAKSALEDRLNQIRISQGELQGQKAQLSYQAIQNYQNTINQVNTMNAQFQQQLQLEHQKAQDYLSQYGQQISQYGSTGNQFSNLGSQSTSVGATSSTPLNTSSNIDNGAQQALDQKKLQQQPLGSIYNTNYAFGQ